MKKLICIIIILTLCAGLPVTVFAENEDFDIDTSYFPNGIKCRGTENDISFLLTDDYYRDRLSSVYVQDNIASTSYVTVFIVEGYEEIKHEIISLLSPRFVVQFHYTIYSLNQKQAAFDELLLENDGNILSIKFSSDYMGIEIVVAEENWISYSEKLTGQYGDFISVHPYYDTQNLFEGIPGQGTVENPMEHWEQNGYPDYISFAFEGAGMLEDGINYGCWIIGITGDNAINEQAVINLLAPTCLITFEKCIYSYSERKIAYEGILALEDDDIIDVILLSDDERVLVIVPDELIAMYDEMLTSGFGHMVWVSEDIRGVNQGSVPSGWGDSLLPIDIPDVISAAGTSHPFIWITFAALLFLFGATTIIFFKRPSFIRVFLTNNGDAVSEDTSASFSKKQVVAAIAGSTRTPSDDVHSSLMKRIKNSR